MCVLGEGKGREERRQRELRESEEREKRERVQQLPKKREREEIKIRKEIEKMGKKKRKYKFGFGTFNCHNLCMTIKSKIFYKLGENYNWTNSKNNCPDYLKRILNFS